MTAAPDMHRVAFGPVYVLTDGDGYSIHAANDDRGGDDWAPPLQAWTEPDEGRLLLEMLWDVDDARVSLAMSEGDIDPRLFGLWRDAYEAPTSDTGTDGTHEARRAYADRYVEGMAEALDDD